MKRGLLGGLCLVLILRVACGAVPLIVSLDFFANPNHVPLYVAEALGFYSEEGIDVEIIIPANPSDPVKLAAARAIDVALTPQINYLIARSEGLPLLAIGALIDHSLGGLLGLAERGFGEMDDLRGKRIGYALAPLEPILWRSMLVCAGIGEGEVELINVGFSTMQALLAGSVDAIGAFRNFEAIQAALQGFEPVFIPQEAYCIPLTYEIILAVHPDTMDERRCELEGFLRALGRAIAFTKERPEEALRLFFEANPDLDDDLSRLSYRATLPLFAAGARHDRFEVWEEIQAYLVDQELIEQALPIEELYTSALLPDE
ncbi:ABC transporter substrate-binding protein [Candidatus Bipolaricaulota bacterium]|nr:ABC transporter substrate-binding protein [Candidatus Bipolaricaulota bacterium]